MISGAGGRKRDEVTVCGICGREPVGDDFPRRVCPRCDALALNDAARPPRVFPDGSGGDNPVSIDGRLCWRHYEPGGWVTMLDVDNCRDYEEFCRRNGLPDA
jgi:hypothetical protein